MTRADDLSNGKVRLHLACGHEVLRGKRGGWAICPTCVSPPAATNNERSSAVAALLRANRGKMVTDEQIYDAIWGKTENPPLYADAMIRLYVTGARAMGLPVMRVHGAGQPGGYLLP